MTLPRRLPPRAWIATLLLSLGFLAWINLGRIRHVERLNQLTRAAPVLDAGSPTGYAGGVRVHLAPGHNNESYQWIAQTQLMLATGQWRLRHVNYDNAPVGRAVTTPSLYRWWLATIAWCDHQLSGHSIGLAVEQAALWADPLLLILFLTGGTWLCVARFGPLPATVFPLVGATLYPFGGAFLPGCPDDTGLALLLSAASALTLLAGILPPTPAETPPKRWFIVSGILGGIGLWLNVSLVTPVLIGLGLGALGGTWLTRRSPAAAQPWRAWSVAGAVTATLAWLIEYAPAHLDLSGSRLNQNHPLYALAWLGGGHLLVLTTTWLRGAKTFPQRRELAGPILAGLAMGALPAIMYFKNSPGFLTTPFAFRLTALGEETEFGNLAKWLVHEGATWQTLAVGLPLLFLVMAGRQLWRREANDTQRLALALVLGPVLLALGFACTQLNWWNQLNALLLVLLVAALSGTDNAGSSNPLPGWRLLVLALALLPGVILLVPPADTGTGVTRRELEGLAERDFAHWLARRTGPDGAIVLAPPNLTTSVYFHGGLRGLGSPYGENEDGFRASVRIAGATSADEAQAVARQRNLTHIVIPSWDDFLDEYARLGADQPDHTLMAMLHTWLPPRWLRPVPYYLPNVKEFEDDRLVIFEMTDVQDHASSLSRLTEYFLDMGQVELASLAAKMLATDYGADLGAQVAKARTELARRDRASFTQSLAGITAGLQDGSSDSLAWDRRVSLSLVLAEGGQSPLARAQAKLCLDEMGELDLRSLSESTLYRFLTLGKKLELQIKDEKLRELAKTLLPPPMRARL